MSGGLFAENDAWVDRQGDVWTLGPDGLMHTPETAPFTREHVEKKWGPLRPAARLTSACACGDCYHPVIGPNTDGEPCDYCRDCGCPSADHARMTRVTPPDGTDENNPIIHRPGCSWETTPYCDCGADPERIIPPADGHGA